MSLPSTSTDRNEPEINASTAFWRALRYLWPHLGIVSVSIICALFAGLTLTGGLGALLPILRLMIYGDTIQGWAARQAVEQRLGTSLAEDVSAIRIDKMKPEGLAEQSGLKSGDVIVKVQSLAGSASPAPGSDPITQMLWMLSDPQVKRVQMEVKRVPMETSRGALTLNMTVDLPPPHRYVNWGRSLSCRLPTHPVWALAYVLGFVLVLTVVGNIVRFFQEYLSDKAAILAVNDLRRRLYDHVLHIPLTFFGMKGTSDVTSRLVQDAQGLQDGFKTVLGQTIQEPIKAAMALGVALWIDWHLTIFIVFFGPLMFGIIKKFGRKMRRASRRALQSSSSMLGQLEGSLIGVRVVKASTAERFERRRYSSIMAKLVSEQLHMSRIDAMSSPILETLTFIVVAMIVLYSAYLVRITKTLKADHFMVLMACLMAIGESLRRCSKVNNSLQKANAAATRIFELLQIPVERGNKTSAGFRRGAAPASEPRAAVLKPIQRDVHFEDVSFSYSGTNSPALTSVNLTVPKGQCIAIVGRNGSGKTTLLALLPRFYDPTQGRVLIDGIDLRRATLNSLRRQIGIVTQETVIFSTSIRENIRYGIPLATDDQITQAAQKAFAHDFIMDKPQGYDTLVGEHGAQLSGGQRQRLCIARAILRQTPILILDEATSQVDAESEHLIQQAIESLMHQRTTFVIAHRFSTILSADRIIVMDRGRIVGQGKHDELLQDCPTYQQLCQRQLQTLAPEDGE